MGIDPAEHCLIEIDDDVSITYEQSNKTSHVAKICLSNDGHFYS